MQSSLSKSLSDRKVQIIQRGLQEGKYSKAANCAERKKATTNCILNTYLVSKSEQKAIRKGAFVFIILFVFFYVLVPWWYQQIAQPSLLRAEETQRLAYFPMLLPKSGVTITCAVAGFSSGLYITWKHCVMESCELQLLLNSSFRNVRLEMIESII